MIPIDEGAVDSAAPNAEAIKNGRGTDARRHRADRQERAGNIAAGGSHWPAAAQGAVDLDETQGNVPLRLGQEVLLLHQVLLQDGHAVEIDLAGLEFIDADLVSFL